MNRIMALTVAGAAAVGSTVIALAAAQAAPQTPANNGNATDTVCVVHLPNNSWASCLKVSLTGQIVAGRAQATGSLAVASDVVGADQIAKIQIDRVAVGTQNTSVVSSHSVNSGTPPHPISVSTSGTDPYYTNCVKRYHVELDYAVRLTDGKLKVGSYVGPWFDSSSPACAGNDYTQNVSGLRCLTNGGSGGCVQLNVSGALSNNGKAFYARGTISVPSGPGAYIGDDQISRVQVDNVVLGHQSGGVGIGPTMNSRDRLPLSAMSQTTSGYTWAHECSTHYQAALNYSVRMKDGRLFTGHLATELFKAPIC